MPAKKPAALLDWHQTREEREAREATDASMLPKTQISKKPPAALKGHAYASAIWRRLIDLYSEVQGTIITAFDEDLIVAFCLGEEELQELFKLRNEVKGLWVKHSKILAGMKPKGEQLKDYFNCLSQANALLERYKGFDSRIDAKRKMLHEFSKSLFLTPRARSGVAPKEKEPEEPGDEMDKLLNSSET
jgi:phage terminase small subunit